MKTHTIRWNGNKSHRIVTFSKQFEKKLLESHPQASSVLISKFLDSLKSLTGRKHTLDYDQEQRLKVLMEGVRGIVANYEQNLTDKWLQDGVRMLDADLITILDVLDWAYKKIHHI